MSNVPLRSPIKATNFPSGEMAGFVSAPSKSVSRVNCALESGFWRIDRERSKKNSVERRAIPTMAAAIHSQRDFEEAACEDGAAAGIFPELVSRFKRFRSARNSAALW